MVLSRIADFIINIYTKTRIFRAKYVRVGKCKICGNCCRSIKLLLGGNLIKTEEEFEEGKRCNPVFKMFYIYDKHPDGVLRFSCRYLGEDNKCKRYFFRPLKCWTYPDHHKCDKDHIMRGKQTKEGCGFRYESTVSFSEVMDFCKDTKKGYEDY